VGAGYPSLKRSTLAVRQDAAVHVLFATAEFAPVVQVGGLGIAAAGLVDALRELGVDVTVVLPDYDGSITADQADATILDVPPWAGPASARAVEIEGAGLITLVNSPEIVRPHPYLQPDGRGWPDNDGRFIAFSAAVAALARSKQADVLHLNDWHTSAALGFIERPPPTVLTIHNLAYQGRTNPGWLLGFPFHRAAFVRDGDCNPLVGAIRMAGRVIAVSPTYAEEIQTPEGGMGIDDELRARRGALVGIRNGIDETAWNPSTDAFLPTRYDWPHLGPKAVAAAAVSAEIGLPTGPGPLVVMVSRLVQQKGVDLLLPILPYLERLPTRLALLGDGDQNLADALTAAAKRHSDHLAFRRGYDERLSHLLFGAGDLLLMPSRFEPCGLAQMQAMRYGTLPIVTDVGGLHDTVIDLDVHPDEGTGIVAPEPSPVALMDAVHRGLRAIGDPKRYEAAQRRGMTTDWSWRAPAREHAELYEQLVRDRGSR
jgi:starch synthase